MGRGGGRPRHRDGGREAEGGAGEFLAADELAFLVAGRVAVGAHADAFDEIAAAGEDGIGSRGRDGCLRAGEGDGEEDAEHEGEEVLGVAGFHSGNKV